MKSLGSASLPVYRRTFSLTYQKQQSATTTVVRMSAPWRLRTFIRDPSELEINEGNSSVDGSEDLQEEQHERKRGRVSPGRRCHQPLEPVHLLLGQCEHPSNNNEAGVPRLKHRMSDGV